MVSSLCLQWHLFWHISTAVASYSLSMSVSHDRNLYIWDHRNHTSVDKIIHSSISIESHIALTHRSRNKFCGCVIFLSICLLSFLPFHSFSLSLELIWTQTRYNIERKYLKFVIRVRAHAFEAKIWFLRKKIVDWPFTDGDSWKSFDFDIEWIRLAISVSSNTAGGGN